jgi:hypothetical protein
LVVHLAYGSRVQKRNEEKKRDVDNTGERMIDITDRIDAIIESMDVIRSLIEFDLRSIAMIRSEFNE